VATQVKNDNHVLFHKALDENRVILLGAKVQIFNFSAKGNKIFF
jgi:hypothetical protein